MTITAQQKQKIEKLAFTMPNPPKNAARIPNNISPDQERHIFTQTCLSQYVAFYGK